MDEFVCHEYYCPACDMPSEEHREGSCRRCGSPLVMLGKKQDDPDWLACNSLIVAMHKNIGEP